jgi:hypothetical protein
MGSAPKSLNIEPMKECIMKKTKLVSVVIFIGLISLSGGTAAHAETNCRQVARDIQSDGLVASTTDPSGQSTVKIFTDALTAYPECKSEIETLYQWNQAQNPLAEFPFPKSGDPKSYPLGPISWWWDVIYNELFGGNVILMFLFGWEIFLAPFPLLIALIIVPLKIAGESLRRNRNLE